MKIDYSNKYSRSVTGLGGMYYISVLDSKPSGEKTVKRDCKLVWCEASCLGCVDSDFCKTSDRKGTLNVTLPKLYSGMYRRMDEFPVQRHIGNISAFWSIGR